MAQEQQQSRTSRTQRSIDQCFYCHLDGRYCDIRETSAAGKACCSGCSGGRVKSKNCGLIHCQRCFEPERRIGVPVRRPGDLCYSCADPKCDNCHIRSIRPEQGLTAWCERCEWIYPIEARIYAGEEIPEEEMGRYRAAQRMRGEEEEMVAALRLREEEEEEEERRACEEDEGYFEE